MKMQFYKIKFYTRKAVVLLLLLSGLSAKGQIENAVKWQKMSDNKGATFYQVQEDFYKYWKDKKVEKGKGYKPFKRWEDYMKPRVYPSGNMMLPSTTYQNFITWQGTETSAPNGLTSTGNWTELGPIGSPSGPSPYSRTGAGRLNFVRFDPSNTNIIYVGAPDGGLWKSVNGGTTWTTNTDFLTVIGCSDLAIDPTNNQILYLATGDLEGNRRSAGILKSTNGGATWTTTGLTWTPLDNYKISKLLMNPANPLNMMISTDGGVFRTTDGWVTSTNTYCCDDLKDMEFKPGDPNTVYAAGEKFFKSTDNGVNWAEITTGLPASDVQRIALGVTAGNSAYVYALIGKASDQSFLGMYRSTNSGTSFSLRSSTPNLMGYATDGMDDGGQSFYDIAVTVSPTNPEIVTTGGVNHWQSTDGGTTWTNHSFWASGEVHADVHELKYLAGSSSTMFSCNDGGLFKSTDNGHQWFDISNNLAIAQVVGIGLSATVSTTIVNGEQDNGTNLKTGSAWANIFGGDGGECFIDPTNNNTIYIQYVQGDFNRSDDGGATTTGIITGLPSGFDFYSKWIMDPVNPNRLYVGGIPTLYTSANKGNLWTALGTPSGTGSILGIAVAPSNTAVIYAIKENRVSRSNNSGATFTNVTGTLPVANAALSAIAVSNTDPNRVVVTFSGYSSGEKVFRSIDGGASWTNISAGLPNLPMNTVVYVNGSVQHAVYVGSDIGVYYFDNSLPSFAPFMTGLPNVAVRDLEIFYPTSKLRAGTYGRGVWESDLNNATILPVSLLSFDVTLKGKKDAQLKWSTATETNAKGYEIEMDNGSGGYKKMGYVQAKGNTTLTSNYDFVVPNLATGTYNFRLKMIDIDSKVTYSAVKNIKITQGAAGVLIYPNPVKNGVVYVELVHQDSKKISVKITNAAGQVVSTVNNINYTGPVKVKVPTTPGQYIIQVTSSDNNSVFKKIITLQ
ncbi:MAG: T9SS type A sorting domain-containing protein [Bacteroidota bacterium]